eukprot:SAG31_NODE_13224_length_884_cov_1.574522_1_plen_162_part_00
MVEGYTQLKQRAYEVLRLEHEQQESSQEDRAQRQSRSALLLRLADHESDTFLRQHAARKKAVSAPAVAQSTIEVTQRVQLESAVVGKVIGKGGRNLNRIRNLTGAKIDVGAKAGDCHEIVTVTVKAASFHAADKACREIRISAASPPMSGDDLGEFADVFQ